ncbi:GHMP kinase, partial [candidate division KSB1 bacterium]
SYTTLIEKKNQKNIQIESADYNIFIDSIDVKKIEYNGNLDLVKAAVKLYSTTDGFKIITQSNAPAGSGLGTSASMGVTLVGLISKYSGKNLLPGEIAEAASMLERKELGIRGGKQDHYASAIGGINYMEFHKEEVKIYPLKINPDIILELEKNLIVCYTGKSRLSGNIHKDVAKNFSNNKKETVDSIEKLKYIAECMKNSLMKGKFNEFAELMNENWTYQKKLHHSITNEYMNELFEIAFKSGALGGKAAGAGGGGCLIFYCDREKEHKVRENLEKSGATVLNFNFDFSGYQNWVIENR